MKNPVSVETPLLWTVLQYCHAAEAPPLPVLFILRMNNRVKPFLQHHCDVRITFMQHIRDYKVRLCQVYAMNDETKLNNFDQQPKTVIAYTLGWSVFSFLYFLN